MEGILKIITVIIYITYCVNDYVIINNKWYLKYLVNA